MLYNKEWNNDPVSKLLNRAADLIEEHGHTKGRLRDETGAMCFVGALHKASSHRTEPAFFEACERVADHLGLDYQKHYKRAEDFIRPGAQSRVVDWNNAPERTAQEVIDAMRAAAQVTEAADVSG